MLLPSMGCIALLYIIKSLFHNKNLLLAFYCEMFNDLLIIQNNYFKLKLNYSNGVIKKQT